MEVLRLMKMLLAVLFIIGLYWDVNAQEKASCSKEMAREAEESIDRLHNWAEIYGSFKKFGGCDDGAIAEGYSDAVVRMLATDWNHLDELVKLSSTDRDFFVFVKRHINATADESEIETIVINSSKKCPESGLAVCSQIEESARQALKELKKSRKG